MRLLHTMRWMLLALLLSLVPASSYAGVFISVGFAPPPLPVYEQPPCPEPGWMWTPGYWAYGPDGYYWVPGAWVPAPYVGALWTPGYWGWGDGLYVWHPGYWGMHVGYYGGVDYGFGYMGIGFVGGRWHDRDFEYNTAVMHVNNVYIHNTYIDRTVVERNTIVNDRHVAYSGGPGGIHHDPTREERVAMHEQHMARTSYQTQHVEAARNDHNSYFNANHGHPQTLAVARPMQMHNAQPNNFNRGNMNNSNRPENRQNFQQNRNEQRPMNQNRPQQQFQQRNENRPQPQQNRPQPQFQQRNESRPQPQQYHPQQQQRNEYRPQPQQRNEYRPQQRPESRPAPQRESRPQHENGRPHGR